MTHKIVRRAHQLFQRVAAHAHERRVGEDDAAFEIGTGDEVVGGGECGFGLGDREVLAHDVPRLVGAQVGGNQQEWAGVLPCNGTPGAGLKTEAGRNVT